MLNKSTIDLNFTINSGQVFLWNKIEDRWFGINGDEFLVKQSLSK